MGRKFSGQNRNEDDVVNAENKLKHDERNQCDPYLGVGYPIHLLILLTVSGQPR
jgi:hypothetical protein